MFTSRKIEWLIQDASINGEEKKKAVRITTRTTEDLSKVYQLISKLKSASMTDCEKPYKIEFKVLKTTSPSFDLEGDDVSPILEILSTYQYMSGALCQRLQKELKQQPASKTKAAKTPS